MMLLTTQSPQKQNPKDVNLVIEGFAIGDVYEAFVEDGGAENNSTKITPLDGDKNNFPSAIPNCCKFSNQSYESYENGYDSDGELVYFDEYAEMGEDTDIFLRMHYVMVLQRCRNQPQ